ncbi:MAG: hypothetical protein VX833_00830 [Actinomycetota bacterium]|nr:hypothetical protein [Actinomycetota bacterium]
MPSPRTRQAWTDMFQFQLFVNFTLRILRLDRRGPMVRRCWSNPKTYVEPVELG